MLNTPSVRFREALALATHESRLRIVMILGFALAVLLSMQPSDAAGQAPPSLVIGSVGPVTGGSSVDVPVTFTNGPVQVSAYVFSIDYDESCLSYTGVTFSPAIPVSYAKVVNHSAADLDGEIDMAVYTFLTSPPLALPNPGGVLATVHFTTTCTPPPDSSTIAHVVFSTSPPPSFASPPAADVPVNLASGYVLIATAPVPATPQTPTWHDIAVCNTKGSATINAVTGVEYRIGGSPVSGTVTGLEGSVTVTAHALPGFVLSGPASFTHVFGTLYPCATPAAPTFVPIATCGVYGEVIINATTGVVYKMGASTVSGTLTGLEGSVTITAEPASGYGFPPSTVASWNGSLGVHKQCATANAPVYTPITACNTWGVFTMPVDTAEVAWSIVPSVPASNHWAGSYTLTATAKAGYAFASLLPTKAFVLEFNDWYPCNSGTIASPVFHAINTCGAYGTIELPSTPIAGVIYVHNSNQYTSGTITGNLAGSQTVSVIAAPGYVLAGPNQGPWTENLGVFKQCATANAPIYTPIAGCNSWGVFTMPTNTAEVVWTIDPAAPVDNHWVGDYTLTATAQAGFAFSPLDATRSFPLAFGTWSECDAGTVVPPLFLEIATCGVYGSIKLPDVAIEGVIYEYDGNDYTHGTIPGNLEGTHQVSVRAADGYTLVGTELGPWSDDLGTYKQCATAIAPAYTPITACNTWGVFTMPTDTAEVAWSILPAPPVDGHWAGNYTLTATANSGYAFADLAPTKTFPLMFDTWFPCASGTVVAPVFHAIAACGAYGSIELPAAPIQGVIYVHNGTEYTSGIITGNLAGSHEVTAIAAPGYTLTGTDLGPWSADLGAFTQCATPEAPTVTAISGCGVLGSVLFKNTAGVSYAITAGNGQEGSVTITATPLAGFSFPTGVQTSFTFNLGTYAPCAGSIGNRVWNDTDGDGVQDEGEPGVEGVVVELYRVIGGNPAPTVLLTTTTDSEGRYNFANLSTVGGLDKYVVRYILPAGYGYTSANVGSDTTDSDAIPETGYTPVIELSSGQADVDEDAGIYRVGLSSAKFTAFSETVKGQPVVIEGVDVILPYNTSDDDWEVTSNFIITNSGTVALTIDSMVDDVLGNIDCPAADSPLAPGASIACSASAQYANDENQNTLDVAASVVGKSASALETDHASTSASSSYVCRGNELHGRWYYETNATFNGFTPGEDFLFKDAPESLVPAALRTIELPVTLSRAGAAETAGRVVLSRDGSFQFSNLDVGEAFTYTLRVGDDAFTPLRFAPVGTSLRFNIMAEDCTTQTFDIGYARMTQATIGDFVWFDVNQNGLQDEWYDADGDGEITQNNDPDTVSLDENGYLSLLLGDYEFIDLNGNGNPDLEGELNKCGIRSTGPILELFDGDNNVLDTAIAGNTGYFRFRSAVVNGVESPLDPQGTYGARLLPNDSNPLLVSGGVAIAETGLCKVRTDIPILAAANSATLLDFSGSPLPGGELRAAGGAPNCASTTVPIVAVNLGDYENGVALDADYGVICVSDPEAEPGLKLMWLPLVSDIE